MGDFGVALKELLVEVLFWMLVTSLYLGGVGAEGRTKWLEEESRLVHLFCESVV